jgi:hypothetical protein
LISLVFDDTPSPWCVLGATVLGAHVMLAMLCLYFLALYVRVTIRSIACLGYCTMCAKACSGPCATWSRGRVNTVFFLVTWFSTDIWRDIFAPMGLADLFKR